MRSPLPERRAEPVGRLPRAPQQPVSYFQLCREADAELVVAEKGSAAGEKGAADLLAAVKEEHDLAATLRKSAETFYVGVNE